MMRRFSMEARAPTAHVSLPLAQKRRRLTVEALADVNDGNTLDYRAVQAWADSLDHDGPLSLPR
ncbi:LOW QUALITY PROTEIN: hypothetical protein Rleg4DRAFT_5293 [Rhizobium leguminosarum bv. trifolii WSM2297]|uniref:Uncharacterized protein n=1 Tax=Rhizobium leguminosarum bv. trifolii WSM2297 TaxID=754762 RepID=J0WCI5_RHILT|nr:LOW QUALITY PROTEIN: hypothetical protein Rleg4DRAFT_5293 [Rhizobium leguminosarum bv. trifolii WSM2297]